MEPAIYIYKMIADNGGAPCVWRSVLSLAICKPKIRRTANKGSIIFGFGGKDYEERLLYIAEVTEKPPTGDYYRSTRFTNRPDCIYQEKPSGIPTRKPYARYHKDSDERARDVGMKFEKADVLLSRDFRYFGINGNADYKTRFPSIKEVVENLKRGHRVNHPANLRAELCQLKKQMWRAFKQSDIGSPTDSDCRKVCNRDSPSMSCSRNA